jgi:fatty acid kinase fatty acid binding subunit
MSMPTICTDSSALLTPSRAASLGVEIVPIAVALDGEPFDELTSSLDWFYERMRAGAQATTSQPSIGEFAAVYERAVQRGAESIVSIHLDARISGTVSSAEAAAAAVEVPVLVVDSRTVSFGVGLCVRAAAAEVAARGRAGDAGRAASRLGAALQNGFVVRGGPGGRIAPDEGWTVYRYEHGAASRITVCPTLTEAVPVLVGLALDGDVPICVAIGHAGREIEPAADELGRRLRDSGQAVEIERYRVGASVGAHTGADSFGLFWWPAA